MLSPEKSEKTDERRVCIGIYTLQTGFFPTILHQKATVGVSLAVAFSLVLQENLSVWSASQFWKQDFFLQRIREDEEILDVFQERSVLCEEKDSFKTV